MTIKEEIGRRIFDARKAKGLTRQALANLTDDLKPSRINNWERGMRTPGPEEIKQLSKVLEVSPAFLMCLTNQTENKSQDIDQLLPLLDVVQACDPISILQAIKNKEIEKITLIPLGHKIGMQYGQNAFALKMPDDSMAPELRRDDILIVDPSKPAQPGNFVVAKVEDNTEIIVRRYKQLSASKNSQQFELLAINTHWANVESDTRSELIGTICGLLRFLS